MTTTLAIASENFAAVLTNMRAIAAEGLEPEHREGELPLGLINGWTIATDGHSLIAVIGDLGAGPFPDDIRGLRADRIWQYAGPLVADWPVEARASLDELGGWAGPARVLRESCEKCKGTGHGRSCQKCRGNGKTLCICQVCDDEHYTTCDECDRRGYEFCSACGLEPAYPRRAGVVLGIPLNQSILANALRFLPGEIALLGRHPEGSERDGFVAPFALWICGNGWRVAVMPIQETAEGLSKLPAFQPKGATA